MSLLKQTVKSARAFALAAACSALLFAGAQSSQAATLHYTEVSTLSGTVDGTPFTNATVTFQTSGDTANITAVVPSLLYELAGTVTFDIAGIGAGTFNGSDSFGVFALHQGATNAVGFLDVTLRDAIPYLGISDTSYDLSTATSLTGTNSFASHAAGYSTTLGTLIINGASGSGSFTATEVAAAPEPSSMALMAGALAAAVGFRRKR